MGSGKWHLEYCLILIPATLGKNESFQTGGNAVQATEMIKELKGFDSSRETMKIKHG